jgi:hypothetical protein
MRAVVRFLAPLAILLFTAGPMAAEAQPRRSRQPPPAMAERCRAMMADMKAMDARLEEKRSAMNAAQGNEKINAMAALLDELVSQRKAMHEKMGAMPMGGCPMMQ